jgi:hypothetical protein
MVFFGVALVGSVTACKTSSNTINQIEEGFFSLTNNGSKQLLKFTQRLDNKRKVVY